MAVINGLECVIKFEGVQLTALLSNSMEFSADMIDVTTKDSTGQFKEYLAGEKGGTATAEALYDPAAAEGFSEAFADLVAGTTLTVYWGETGNTETYYSCEALIERIRIDGPKNEAASWSVDLRFTGKPTEGTVTTT